MKETLGLITRLRIQLATATAAGKKSIGAGALILLGAQNLLTAFVLTLAQGMGGGDTARAVMIAVWLSLFVGLLLLLTGQGILRAQRTPLAKISPLREASDPLQQLGTSLEKVETRAQELARQPVPLAFLLGGAAFLVIRTAARSGADSDEWKKSA